MNRKQEIEDIIIGTLLCSTDESNYYVNCRCCITEDMFTDETNRRIYRMVAELNSNGCQDVNPYTILMKYGEEVLDICYRMCELSTDCSFVHKKVLYNERQYLIWSKYGYAPKYTEVTFDDYINRLIQLTFSNAGKEKRREGIS